MSEIYEKLEEGTQDVVDNSNITADSDNAGHGLIDYDKELPDYMGSMQRFELVIKDPMTMEIVIQRVIDGESLKSIARAWKIPVLRFVKWISDDEKRLFQYESALRIRADEAINEALEISDEQKAVTTENGNTYDPEVPRDKLRIDTRLKIAAMWDKQRYGGEKATGGAGINIIINREGALSALDENTVVIDA